MKTVVHYTDTVGFGGAEKMLLTLVEGLDRTRWRSVLFYHPHPGVRLLVDEARVRGLETVGVPRSRRAYGVVAVGQLVRAVRACKPDVFHAHLTWGLRCSQGLSAAFLARVPHRVATQQLYVGDKRRTQRYRHLAMSMLVDRYVAVSNATAIELARSVLDPTKVRVVYNGIEVERFDNSHNSGIRAALTNGSQRPVVLSLARLHWQKGLLHLIEAASQVPEAVFAVAGEGDERARLEAEVNRRGLADRFHLLGHRDDISDLLDACDVFVLPSLFEGLPVSILEAMAAGKPVVASAIRGTDEAVVDGETGLLVAPGNSDALTAAIRRVLSEPCLARRLAIAGRARVEQHFSAASMVSGVEQLYGELLDG